MTQSSFSAGVSAGPRVRVEGVLDMARVSDASFLLRLPDGRDLPGRLVGRPFEGLARVLGRTLLVFGVGQFGPNGELESIEADGFLPADGQPWDISPQDMPFSDDVARELARRQQAIRGGWPGDETDEEINQALKEMS
jgi:hypothetical protein